MIDALRDRPRQRGDRASNHGQAERSEGSRGHLLPFANRKRKSQSDEVELGEDDFELVELVDVVSLDAAPPPASRSADVVAASPRNADQARTIQRPSRPRTILPVSRRILDEEVEEDVAGQCLASIAAETSRESIESGPSSSHIRAALARPQPPEALRPSAPPTSSTSRLPSVIAPPFLRTSTVPLRGYNDAPGVRDSSPPPAFVRRSSPVLAAAVPAAAPSSYVAVVAASASGASGTSGSVAPVSMPMSQRHEPTVIVVRERPRAAWMFAAAAMGALGALGATRFLATPPAAALESRAVAVSAPQAAPVLPALPAPVLPALAVTAPPASVPPAPPASALAAAPPAVVSSGVSGLPPAIVHFGDDDGVAFKSPAPRRPSVAVSPAALPSAPPAPPAPSVRSTGPRAPSMGPALPDGSFGLGRSDTATTATAPPPAPALTASAPAEPPRKRALTPEQQLAAAQLKASMK